MKFEVYKSMSNGEIVFNIYEADSKHFVVSCHHEETAVLIAELLTTDNKEQ